MRLPDLWLRLALAMTLAAAACTSTTPVAQPASTTPAGATTVILVRHAEKVDGPGDVGLSPTGETRAQLLAETLADAGVDAVVTTQYRRTRETVEPLTTRSGIMPEVVPAGSSAIDAHLDAIAAAVGRLHGRTVLIVGHSNTIPLIARRLGVAAPNLTDSEYDHLWIVTLRHGAEPSIVRAHYGAPTR